jgi:tripartite-type tricarboxylate transporter receptor subunit TctC
MSTASQQIVNKAWNFASWLVVAAMWSAPMLTAEAAEKYPSRPIRMIIPSGAGGITDILGRVIAPKLTESFGQQVVVDNRPGASGIVGSHIVAKAAPDGYTLLMVFPSHVVNQSLYPDIPYDTVKAFAPITLVSAVSPVLIVASQFPARSVQELIAIAKEKPGQLNHGSVGAGSMGHLGAELFRSMARITITFVTYKGSPQALTALLSWRRRETAHRRTAGCAANRGYPARLRGPRLERYPGAGGHAQAGDRAPQP